MWTGIFGVAAAAVGRAGGDALSVALTRRMVERQGSDVAVAGDVVGCCMGVLGCMDGLGKVM